MIAHVVLVASIAFVLALCVSRPPGAAECISERQVERAMQEAALLSSSGSSPASVPQAKLLTGLVDHIGTAA